jgi:hypothetical protein
MYTINHVFTVCLLNVLHYTCEEQKIARFFILTIFADSYHNFIPKCILWGTRGCIRIFYCKASQLTNSHFSSNWYFALLFRFDIISIATCLIQMNKLNDVFSSPRLQLSGGVFCITFLSALLCGKFVKQEKSLNTDSPVFYNQCVHLGLHNPPGLKSCNNNNNALFDLDILSCSFVSFRLILPHFLSV